MDHAHQENVEEENVTEFRYRECQKNHAPTIGGLARDGCGEFMPAGDEGTIEALHCAACTCHRSFHRKEPVPAPGQQPQAQGTFHHIPVVYYYHSPTGYLHVPPAVNHDLQLALPSASTDLEAMSNPSSSAAGGFKKRFRSKFTREQKDRMLQFAVRLGWRIKKDDVSDVEDFCAQTGINRQVFKIWMHNNKYTVGKKA